MLAGGLAKPLSGVGHPGGSSGFAAGPDNGQLLEYPSTPVIRRTGAYTWNRVQLSEAHAVRSVLEGRLSLTGPDGVPIGLEYVRHIEHPDGNWSWVGRNPESPGQSAVITFGPDAVFGTVPQGRGRPALRLTTADGAGWAVTADPRELAKVRNAATHPAGPDFLVPPKLASASLPSSSGHASMVIESAASASQTVVDVLIGYTDGFAASRGGTSAATTRLHNLVDITNQAYANSQVNAQLRLVHSMPVSYPDATANKIALEELTGFRAPSTRTTPAPAFNALRSARDQYGADLVVLVRQFQDPENEGCGIAWLIGGNRSGIKAGDEFFGYSVVSDGQDRGSDGKTYFCRDVTFAHEIAHNMGSAHDEANSKKDDGTLSYGAFAYSFGYSAPSAFFTIMAYGDRTTQREYAVFSNPRIASCGAPCGVADKADNARSLNETVGTIAQFRSTVVVPAPEPSPRVNLLSIARMGGSNFTEAHALSGASTYQSFVKHLATALHQTGSGYDWRFQLGDFNSDGHADIYAIAKMGGSGTTEVHVLNGADGFRTFLAHSTTALHQTGTDNVWAFKLGDMNRDGVLDLYAIGRQGSSGKTEVHVLDGASSYRSFLVHAATALHATGSDGSWDFALGDHNRDGSLDLYAIAKRGGSSTTEVHILNGASGYQSFLLQSTSALHTTGADKTWEFKVGDYNGDGIPDVYSINRSGASGRTEVHVLDGARNFSAFLANIATGLHSTDASWEFELGG